MSRWLRRALLRAGLATAALAVVGLLGINGIVRLAGGEPALMSPYFLRNKVRAIGRLFAHAISHPFGSCGDDRRKLLGDSARKHGVPENLVIAVAHTESGFGAHSISHAGAMGVMQLTPDTAEHLRVNDPFDAAENIDGGVRYLARMLARYDGDQSRATAAYNAGPERVPRRGPLSLPRETERYVERVKGHQTAGGPTVQRGR